MDDLHRFFLDCGARPSTTWSDFSTVLRGVSASVCVGDRTLVPLKNVPDLADNFLANSDAEEAVLAQFRGGLPEGHPPQLLGEHEQQSRPDKSGSDKTQLWEFFARGGDKTTVAAELPPVPLSGAALTVLDEEPLLELANTEQHDVYNFIESVERIIEFLFREVRAELRERVEVESAGDEQAHEAGYDLLQKLVLQMASEQVDLINAGGLGEAKKLLGAAKTFSPLLKIFEKLCGKLSLIPTAGGKWLTLRERENAYLPSAPSSGGVLAVPGAEERAPLREVFKKLFVNTSRKATQTTRAGWWLLGITEFRADYVRLPTAALSRWNCLLEGENKRGGAENKRDRDFRAEKKPSSQELQSSLFGKGVDSLDQMCAVLRAQLDVFYCTELFRAAVHAAGCVFERVYGGEGPLDELLQQFRAQAEKLVICVVAEPDTLVVHGGRGGRGRGGRGGAVGGRGRRDHSPRSTEGKIVKELFMLLDEDEVAQAKVPEAERYNEGDVLSLYMTTSTQDLAIKHLEQFRAAAVGSPSAMHIPPYTNPVFVCVSNKVQYVRHSVRSDHGMWGCVTMHG